MIHMALNIAVLLMIAFCVWQGYRKGLILTVCGVVIVFIAAYTAGQVAANYAGSASESLAPVLDWLPDAKIEEAIDEVGLGRVESITDMTALREIADVAFEKIGITGAFRDILSAKTMNGLNSETNIRQSIESQFLYGIAYLILCVFTFLIVFILLTLLIHFLSAVFKLPVLGLIDKIGGSALGLVNGLLLLCFLGWILQFIGVFLPSDMIVSGLLRGFMNLKWLNGFLN